MSLNSVNTNMGAMIALQSLNRTNTDLAATEKRISTGSRVADAVDDGAAYAVAQAVRSTVGALGAANQQLGNVQGLLATTNASLNDVSNTMASMRTVLVKLADSNVAGDQRTQYVSQYASLLGNVKTFFQDAGYSGKTLIGEMAGSSGTFSRVATVRNESGASYGITTFAGSAMFDAVNFGSVAGAGTANVGVNSASAVTTAQFSSGSVAALLTAGGTFMLEMATVGAALNTLGSETNYVTNQVKFNNDKIDALNTGLGALVDADLAKESAMLQALQIRQQLGTQALSLANQAPQTLLSLFK
jgi:flagellin